jgi:hypothetical protein
MITGALKRDIDRLWTEFWTGGITNPLTVIEQITFLMFARLLDIQETADERCQLRVQGRATPACSRTRGSGTSDRGPQHDRHPVQQVPAGFKPCQHSRSLARLARSGYSSCAASFSK